MGKNTDISWASHTFSPWHGCVEVSEACDNCYAREFDHRYGGANWGKDAPRRFFKDKHWNEPLKWNKEAAKAGEIDRVFCASMSDVFETYDILESHRQRLWDLIPKTPNLIWMLLTKRPQNIFKMLPASLHNAPNIWLGTTLESPKYLWRIDALLETEAPVHFLSMEPLLEETSIRNKLNKTNGISWVISGCESGKGCRYTPTSWYRQLRDDCIEFDIPYFLKQAPKGLEGITSGDGSWTKLATLAMHADGKAKQGIIEEPYLDGQQWIQVPKTDAQEEIQYGVND